MTLKVVDRQQMVYQANYHGPFWMIDDEERLLSILYVQFWRVGSAIIYAIFIILANYLCL